MAPPSCPPPIGDVNPERYLFPPLSWMSTISMVGKSAADTTAAAAAKQIEQNHERAHAGRFPLFFLFICALWAGSHT